MIFKICVVVLLVGIIYEDFKFRSVHLMMYLAVIAILVYIRIANYNELIGVFVDTVVNTVYLLLLLIVSILMIYVKKRGRRLKVFSYIGSGDIIFWFALACWFQPVEFIFFITLSLLGSLLLHVILCRFSFYNVHNTVALAGLQCTLFLPVFIFTDMV